MKVFNEDLKYKFWHKRNAHKNDKRWKEKKGKIKLLYILLPTICVIISIGMISLEEGNSELWEYALGGFAGGFLGWIPALSYSKLFQGKLVKVAQNRVEEVVIIDDSEMMYLYHLIGNTKVGYKIFYRNISKITVDNVLKILSVESLNIRDINIDFSKNEVKSDYHSREKEILIPMYFGENNNWVEEFIKSSTEFNSNIDVVNINE